MTPELAHKLATAVDAMPAFPQSVQKILELTRDVNCSPKELVQVIDKDPVVMVKILRVVNSAYFKLPRQVVSVDHAVVYLGFNTIKNLALGIAAIGMLPAHNAAKFDGPAYLVHSLSTAAIAKMLAARVGGVEPMDCFIAGLLHDFGKVVFAQFMPQELHCAIELSASQGLPLHEALRSTLGTDHAVAGAMLIEKWRFPNHLAETIRYQFDTEVRDTAEIACVFAANQVSKRLKFGYAGNACVLELPQAMAQRLGGTLDAVIASLGDLTAVHDEARLFSKV